MTAVEPSTRQRTIRLPIGLLLAIGDEKPERGPGRQIDYFRAKPGDLNQYATEAAKFLEVYGERPDTISDVYFLANDVPSVLEIRLLAFGTSGLRGIGMTNFAEITDDTEFEARVFGEDTSFYDDFVFFPKDVSEVRAADRETWEGQPIEGRLEGRNDPRVKRLDVKMVASLEFCLPQVMGVGKVARISSSGRTSIRNLWKALWAEYLVFGNLAGLRFRLANRPRKKSYYDSEKRAMMPTTIRELVLDTPETVTEIYEAIEARRKALGPGGLSRDQMALEGRALAARLALPPAEQEERTREEVDATASDALLNKLAALTEEVGEAQALAVLRGVYGVDSATELSAADAERYWQMLERALGVEDVEVELVDEDPAAGQDGGVKTSAPDSPAAGEDSTEGPEATAVAHEDSRGGSSSAFEDKSDEPPSVDESGVADDPPSTAAPDAPLPGEPRLMAAVDVAADMVVPKGTRRNMKLADVDVDWLEYSLGHPQVWEDQLTFYSALEFFVRERHPDLWKRARG